MAHAAIKDLIATLASSDGLARQQARATLVEIDRPATSALLALMSSSDPQLRWEAAKTLSEFDDPQATPALVQLLEDEVPGIRWLAAEGLAKIGSIGLPPLLEALMQRSDSVWLRQGTHHALNVLQATEQLPALTTVLAALEGPAPVLTAPLAARHALDLLQGKASL